MPAPAVLPLVAGGGTKLLSALGLVKNLAATGAVVGAGTAIAGPFIAPEFFGQSAEQVLRKDMDKAEYNPVSQEYEVKRDAKERLFDKLFRRTEAIQTQGEKNRLKQLLEDNKALFTLRPELKKTITGQTGDEYLANLLLKTQDQTTLINQIKATGKEPLSKSELYQLDVGELESLNTKRQDEKKIADIKLASDTNYNLQPNVDARAAAEKKEYRIERDRLDLLKQQLQRDKNAQLDRQDQFRLNQMQYDLQNRRLNMQEARNTRNDRNKAIMQILSGFTEMNRSFRY